MGYDEALQYIDNLEQGKIRLGLDNINLLLKKLGDPHLKYKTIHVTGTNGKGSVVAMCRAILTEAGYKTGMYTSPHFNKLNERIQINGKEISNKKFLECFNKVEIVNEYLKDENVYVSYYEFITAMAFVYFANEEVDFAIIEVGLGGRLDATNVVEPLISVINNIHLDHTKILGEDLISIAKEKGGIIKKNGVLVTGEKNQEVLKLFKETCNEKNVKFVVSNDIRLNLINSNLEHQEFLYDDLKLNLPLLGIHQKENLIVTLKVIEELKKKGIVIKDRNLISGLKKVTWPGRMEVIQKNPLVILDCAHNPNAVENLVFSLKRNKIDNVTLILGASEKKDYLKMVKLLFSICKRVVLTKAKFKGLNPELLRKEFVEINKKKVNPQIIEDVAEATGHVLKDCKNEDTILITGSIFVVGEARRFLFLKK